MALVRRCAGLVLRRGSGATHVAVLTRAWGLPCIVRAQERATIPASAATLDATAGVLRLGAEELTPPRVELVVELVDRLESALGAPTPAVYANAETPEEVARAVSWGVRDVGVVRTEHLFLGAAAHLVVDAARGPADRREQSLRQIGMLQREAVSRLLAVPGLRTLVVRLLDPPLHEFADERTDVEPETNPMMGVRGVRLGLLCPPLYDAQVEAIGLALAQARAAGFRGTLPILVPFLTWPGELTGVADRVREVSTRYGIPEKSMPLAFMVETPQAVRSLPGLLRHARLVSIGSNDLTQFALGLSRDDTESTVIAHYVASGITDVNPFTTLCEDSVVADLVRTTVSEAHRAGAVVGLCGEHGGDPASAEVLRRSGLDYVSCSTWAIPAMKVALWRARASG
jgi:pyruvate,orthophosphate dikinase